MLYERFIKYPLDEKVISRTVWKGLPQGSVLSPILYNVYTYDLENMVNIHANILQYADDLLLYTHGKFVDKICSDLTSAMTVLKTWLHSNGLDLSLSKSSVVLFSRKRSPPLPRVMYNELPLPVKYETKFLGVILDSKLTGVPHCDNILIKCERILNMLRCITGVWWGAHPVTMKLVYNALIRSVIDYGTFLLHPGNTAAFKKLDNIQTKALRLIIGAMKSSPIKCLQVECCEPPLALRRQYLSDRFFYRCLQINSHPLLHKLNLLSQAIEQSNYWTHKDKPCLIKSLHKYKSIHAPIHCSYILPIYQYSYSSVVLKPVIEYNIGISKQDYNPNHEFKYILDNKWAGFQYIFTDASKHPNTCVGVGVYHTQYKIVQQIRLPPESTVYSGECYGLYKAVEYVILAKLKCAIIFTDSQSSLQALSRFPFKSHKQSAIIFDIRNLLMQCTMNGYKLIFAWIPSHVGIFGNEKADQLANDAILVGDKFPYKNYCQDLIPLAKVHTQEIWDRLWLEGTDQGKFYRRIQDTIPRKPWYNNVSYNKNNISILCRMRLGHACTPAHLYKQKIIAEPTCSCGKYGDLNHIFFSCDNLDHSSFIVQLLSIRIPFPTSIICLLYNADIDIYNIIAEFIINNDIKL